MAVIKNTYETTYTTLETPGYDYTNFPITGLTSSTSGTPYVITTNHTSYPITLYFLRSIYQTLLDAGYSDTILNESDYSLTVLGFKFFCICQTYRSGYALTGFQPGIFVYGSDSCFNDYGNYYQKYSSGTSGDTSSRYYVSISNITESYSEGFNNIKLSFNVIVRGCKDCVQIAYSSYAYPNSEVPLIFIAKAKNLITSEDAFFYTSVLTTTSSYSGGYWHFRDKSSDLYTYYKDYVHNYGTYNCPYPYKQYQGLNSISKYVCKPVVTYSNSFLIPSMIEGNTVLHERGKYYKIGSELYFCNNFKIGLEVSNSNSLPVLFKVSDD